jgi:transcriptional regulator with XRE-family HTH domain
MDIGVNIQKIREDRGFTLKDMAERLDLTEEEYNLIENNQSDPRLSILEKIAEIFNCSISYLLTLKESEGYHNNFFNHAGFKGHNNVYQGLHSKDLIEVFQTLYGDQLKRIPILEKALFDNQIQVNF